MQNDNPNPREAHTPHTTMHRTTETLQQSQRPKWKNILPVVLALAAVGTFVILRSFASTGERVPFDTTKNHILSVEKVARLPLPASIRGRDGGASVVLGNKLLWLFGDTFYNPVYSSRPADADIWRTSTASYSNPSDPFGAAQLAADANGNPVQIVPFTSDEITYNRNKNNVSDRYVIWPSGQVAQDKDTALIFFIRFLAGTNQTDTGVATIRTGQSVASRQDKTLFSAAEPKFRKAIVKDGYVYLYATSCPNNKCPVARAPLSLATQRSSYTFWDGTNWNQDITKAQAVIPVSNYGYTVMWSEALGKYLQAMIGNLSHQVYFSYADNPQGPWSNPVKAFEVAGKSTYVPYFHPSISNGQIIYMSYNRDDTAICKSPCTDIGGVEILKVTLDMIPSQTGGQPEQAPSTPTGTAATSGQVGIAKSGKTNEESANSVSSGNTPQGQKNAISGPDSPSDEDLSGTEGVPRAGVIGILDRIKGFLISTWETLFGWL